MISSIVRSLITANVRADTALQQRAVRQQVQREAKFDDPTPHLQRRSLVRVRLVVRHDGGRQQHSVGVERVLKGGESQVGATNRGRV